MQSIEEVFFLVSCLNRVNYSEAIVSEYFYPGKFKYQKYNDKKGKVIL